MRGLIQRVSQARVEVAGETTGAIGQGILLLLGVEAGDTVEQTERLLQRVVNYRIFADADGRMNRSLLDVGGGLLVVSQFTLAADTRKGLRPSFTPAAAPDHAQALYEHFLAQAAQLPIALGAGRFAADMQVSLTNDGPVTFLLQV